MHAETLKKASDSFGRTFPYLRLSITDMCNFRCVYCLPNGYKKTNCASFLSSDEIRRLIKGFSNLGTTKVRLTGGEPTLRKDFIEIVKEIRKNTSIQKIALTTNGYNLKQDVIKFKEAGISAINVSIDSLDSHKFHLITGHHKLETILDGLTIAKTLDFDSIKINTVLLKCYNETDIQPFFEWIKNEPYHVRFIELMETGENKVFFDENHFSANTLLAYLKTLGFSEKARSFADGPARVFTHSNYCGSIGIIAPYAKDFCTTCNRLRITAKGHLKLCLFSDSSHDLRPYLQNDADQAMLEEKILDLLRLKKETHNLHNRDVGMTPHLASTGG